MRVTCASLVFLLISGGEPGFISAINFEEPEFCNEGLFCIICEIYLIFVAVNTWRTLFE